MKFKFTAALLAFAFVLNAFGATVSADPKTAGRAAQTGALAALLPASDGIVTIDVKKVLNEAAPQILSGKPQTLADINRQIDEIREKTGLDLRQFEQVAVGVSVKTVSEKEYDLEPLVMARGKYNASALIALAKVAANGKFREEKIGARTVYVFSMEDVTKNGTSITRKETPSISVTIKNPDGSVEQKSDDTDNQTAAAKKDSWFDKALDRMINGLLKEIAVVSYDNNTLAVGSLARVRETLNVKTRGNNAALLGLMNRKPNAVVAFAADLPNGLSNFIDLDNDQLGKTIDSIRQISGAMELAGVDTAISATAKTARVEDAQSLLETLQGLQLIGKSFLGGSKTADKQVFSRMIDNAKFTRAQTEVSLGLQVPQTDINILLGAK